MYPRREDSINWRLIFTVLAIFIVSISFSKIFNGNIILKGLLLGVGSILLTLCYPYKWILDWLDYKKAILL